MATHAAGVGGAARWWCAQRCRGGEVGTRACHRAVRAVVDYHRLPDCRRQLRRDQARGEIIAAAVHEEAVDAAGNAAAAGDDLTRIKGVGPKLSAMLHGLGITSFAQIAAWSEADLARIDPQLGAFAGRPARDQWIEQARLLGAGDTAAYEAQFGKL